MKSSSVVSDSSPTRITTIQRPAVELTYELAAAASRIMDLKDERRKSCKTINEEIKDLEKRQRELIGEIKAGGTQLALHFGTVETEQ